MSSASENQGGRQHDGRPSKPLENGASPGEGSFLLEQVLASTPLSAGEVNALPPEELEAVKQVARRHPGRMFSARPVLEELIEAMVGKQLRGMVASPAARASLVSEIAQTLYDDDATRARLEAIWQRLAENP
jgi:hypothetical protein